MTKEEACKKGEELAKEYNPKEISPFPFEQILEINKDLSIVLTSKLPDSVSGGIAFRDKAFFILINENKPKTRQHFTTAHEIGHYFLHKEIIQKEETIIDSDSSLDHDSRMLYRLDESEHSKIETEANNFAASLIMPKGSIIKAWKEIKNIVKCAEIFNVSVSAMAIRLERLKLI